MTNLDDLIKIEKEYTGLDFKRIQYSKEIRGEETHEDFIKDIMSMANADIKEDRYIVIGVIYKNSNDRELLGINKDDFIDSAIYQELIRENIEPQIIFDYFKHEVDGVCFGIFKITQCNDQPYMMKKDFRNLRKGECLIRKGDSQSRLIRADFDRIIDKIITKKRFNGKVKIYFSGSSQDQEITLPAAKDIQLIQLPSERAANKIRDILKRKKSSPNPIDYPVMPFIIGYNAPYEKRSIEELERNLRDIKETYKDDDYYEFFELRSYKLNITIMNEGDEYIEDASLQIDIEKINGLIIPEKIYYEPEDSSDFTSRIANVDFGRYPKVEDNGSFIRIYNSSMVGRLGKWDIKHQMPDEAFLEPVRFLLSKNLAGNVIQLNCKLYGKNLKEPLETILKIKVVPNETLIE